MILNIDKNIIEKIRSTFPFLISVASNNKIEFIDETVSKEVQTAPTSSKINDEFIKNYIKNNENLINSEIIGVIDSYAKLSDAWKEIIEINNMKLPLESLPDFTHGTQVSTLIAACDAFNNIKYKDGLGIFKVRHFGLLPAGKISVTYAVKKIEEIIKNNYEKIKIWNLSIESKNIFRDREKRISELGKFLDKLQAKYDVLIVISSGNKKAISYAADSLLSLTVGSMFYEIDNTVKKTSYTGEGKVFNIYEKPNIYDFGNDITKVNTSDLTLWTLDESGFIDTGAEGTSFAAPLVTRKCAYLKSRYNLSIQTIRAYINLQKEVYLKKGLIPISKVKIEEMDCSRSCIILYNGKIKSRQTKYERLSIPLKKIKDKKYRDLHYAISVSYSVHNYLNVGDEYSSLEISAKIMGELENKKERKNFITLEKTTNSEQQTQVSLIKHFKKYNSNKVLIDSDLDENKHKMLYNTLENSIFIEISCNDLFDNVDSDIKYGLVSYLRGMDEKSIENFEILNQEILEKVETIKYKRRKGLSKD